MWFQLHAKEAFVAASDTKENRMVQKRRNLGQGGGRNKPFRQEPHLFCSPSPDPLDQRGEMRGVYDLYVSKAVPRQRGGGERGGGRGARGGPTVRLACWKATIVAQANVRSFGFKTG